VPYRVHALVNLMQPTRADPLIRHLLRDTQSSQLRERDQAPLVASDHRDLPIHASAPTGRKVAHIFTLRPVGGGLGGGLGLGGHAAEGYGRRRVWGASSVP